MTGANAGASVQVPAGPPRRVAARGWGSHRTIGAGLRAADGSVVTISPGAYPESLVVDRDVTIVADTQGGAVELVCVGGPALLIRGGSVTVQGLVIRGAQPHPAVMVSGGSLTLRDCDVSGGRPTVAGPATRSTVRDCTFRHSGGAGI